VTELSVVLVNYNGAAVLPRTLHALAENTQAEQVECIVVDSGSTDESWRSVEGEWDKARALRLEENVGFSAGCNRGVDEAAGRLVAFVNFDGEVEPGWDAPLSALLDDSSIAVATGVLLSSDGATVEAAGLEIAPNMATFGRLEGTPRTSLPTRPFDVTAASGALMMVRREDFRALGGFYAPIFMYGEEADYCLRANGRVVVDPHSAIRHEVGHAAGPPRSPLRLYYGSRNRLLNAARHLPGPALAKSIAASAAFDALTLAQVRRLDAARAVARGWGDGLRAMKRERGARSAADRRRSAGRLSTLRDALSQQRMLGRL
jgi:N-acetylglucosaminyl-diphospho-decaprenol L-rhamnosyltransferase